jgi:predicted RNA-binding Zn-ribbon protein involved in translation (DUF1610 family)
MNKHDNIYNILGKLASLEPQPPKQESILKQLNESATAAPSLAARLNERYQEHKNLWLPESEQKTMSRAAKGHEKYGKEGMQALAKAGRNSASDKELDKIRDRHNKYDESVEVDEDMLAKKDYDGDGKKETPKDEYMGSRDKAIKKAMGKDKEKTDEDAVPGKSWVKDPQDPASKVPAYQRKANEPGRQAAQDRADAANAKAGAKVFRSGRAAPMEESAEYEKQIPKGTDDKHVKFKCPSCGTATNAGIMRGNNYVCPSCEKPLPAKNQMPLGEEEQYDENDAHSSLPGMRKTSDKEHSEYDAAAHTIRKWMRKRGWNTNKEFKPALKYIMDNLEDKHDDSLTDEVKEAAQVCEKHHMAVAEAGLDMNLLKGAQGAMQGANTDPESERNRSKKYGYRSDRDDTGNDDDYDEHGNEKKGAKKSAPSDAPKKKGRPKKNFGPERTTAKAWKHKGARVSEAINLEHYVEDVMEELEAMFIIEKAKSKSQQRFFGMVHAAKKGEKPASKEVAKAAKGMSKKDAKDFAKTKHKGLPDKVTEGVNFAEMVRETGNTIEEMLNELNMEMQEFKRSGHMGDKLRDALDIHRAGRNIMGETPEEPKDKRTDFFYNPDVSDDEQLPPPPDEVNLDELALLAGLHGGQKKLDKDQDGKITAMDFEILRGDNKNVDEGSCNMTPEGQYCEVHGMGECGMMEGAMAESKGSKPDYIDLDKDGNKKEPMKKAAKDAKKTVKEDLQADDGEHYQDSDDFFSKFEADHFDHEEESDDGMEVRGYIDGVNVMAFRYDDESKTSGYGVYNDDELMNECGMGGMSQEDGVSINTSMDTKTGRKTVTVTADGEAAEELATMLKMAGMVGKKPEPKVISLDKGLEEYANEPDEQYASTDAILRTGNDLHKSKIQDPATANRAANPLEEQLTDLYKRMKERS